MKYVLALIVFFKTITSFAQHTCGTIATEHDIKVMTELLASGSKARSNSTYPTVNIPLTIHILREDDGSGGLAVQELNEALMILNDAYKPINFNFFINEEIKYIDNSGFYDFDSSREAELTGNNNISSTINIYFFNSLTSGGSNLCGYAYFPSSGRDHIMMANGCAASSTLPHEVGHYFALYHTHGKTNTGTTDELVDGSNCSVAGDDVCDTPADPNLSGNVDGLCSYTGGEADENGDFFDPFPKNIMSYSISSCREQFTSGQYDRVINAFQTFKTYLSRDILNPELTLSNRFACTGSKVQFENISNNYSSIQWEFEGGEPSTSLDENVSVTYNEAGRFDVKLTLFDDQNNQEELLLEDYIVVENEFVELREGIIRSSFEDSEFVEEILNPDNDITFTSTGRASFDGNKSLFIELYGYRSRGQKDQVLLSTINSDLNKIYEVEFSYANAQYGSSNDGLRLVYRDQCGDWVTVWEKYGEELSTAGDLRYYFVPEDDQWENEIVQFEVPDNVDRFELAFESVNDFGNNIYIDDYKIQSVDPTFTVDEIIVTPSTCNDSNDGQIVVNTSGEGTFEYAIESEDVVYRSSNTFENLAPGDYRVLIKKIENGSVKDEVVNVSFIDTRPNKPEIRQIGDFLQINAGVGQTIVWYLDGEVIDGETSASLLNPSSGTYEAELISGPCSSISDPFVILSAEKSINITLSPNPAEDYISINFGTSNISRFSVNLLDVSGRSITRYENQKLIDLSYLPKGVYLVKIMDEGRSITRRIIKK
ncbi:T9SS type A sorting domain-containing protein [Ekhidna sp.]|uniref:T9SS type A sorting domain-containing protein n=1 Tax=Ekhidna sp. TaxID=2608089 RepID=UPI003CCC0958